MKIRILAILIGISIISCKKKEEEEKQATIDFTYSGNIGTPPSNVSFTATPSDAGTVEWDFGDGTTASGTSVSHTYTNTGFFSVYCKLTTSYGSAGKTKNVNVSPYTFISILELQGTAPLLNTSGIAWDASTDNDPDLFFRVYNSNGNEVGNTAVGASNTFQLQLTINPAISFYDFDETFKVKLFDYDLSPDTDDLVGEFSFRPADYFPGSGQFPAYFQKTDANTGATGRVKVGWRN